MANVINHEYFVVLDSMAYSKIKYTCNINNAVQGHLSENYLPRKIIAWNSLDMKINIRNLQLSVKTSNRFL